MAFRTLIVGLILAAYSAPSLGQDMQEEPVKDSIMEITSAAFAEGDTIPMKYTCDGQGLSPPLAWTGVPEKAVSLVLIMDDPDAPMGIWAHWVLFDIPADMSALDEGILAMELADLNVMEGINSWSNTGYGGPCPPSGTHRYHFRLYALNKQLSLGPYASKEQVSQAMTGHVMAEAQLIGLYSHK